MAQNKNALSKVETFDQSRVKLSQELSSWVATHTNCLAAIPPNNAGICKKKGEIQWWGSDFTPSPDPTLIQSRKKLLGGKAWIVFITLSYLLKKSWICWFWFKYFFLWKSYHISFVSGRIRWKRTGSGGPKITGSSPWGKFSSQSPLFPIPCSFFSVRIMGL